MSLLEARAPAGAGATGLCLPDAAKAMADRSTARSNAVSAFLVRCVSAALLYVTQVILARSMGASEYGIHVTVWTAVLIAGGMATLGLNLGVMRLIPVYRAAGDTDGLRGLVVGARALAFGLGVLAAAVGYAVLETLPMSDSHRAAAEAAVLCLPLFAMADVQDGLGRGHGWMMPALLPPYVLRPLLLLAVMGIAYLAGAPLIAVTAAASAAIAVGLAAVVQALWLHAKLRKAQGAGPRSYDARMWIVSSLPLLAVATAELMLQNTDVLVLSRFAPPAEVAIYFAAAKTMSLMMFVHYAVGSAMASRFAGLKERGDLDGLQAAAGDAVSWTFWPSLAVAMLILVCGRPLLELFGPGFADAHMVMAVLVMGFLIRSAMGPAEMLLSMMGEQRACAVAMATGALTGLVLNLVLVPIGGAMGAAVATSISLATVGLLNATVVKSRLGIKVAIWHTLAPPSALSPKR